MCGLFAGCRLVVVLSCRCRAVDSRPGRRRSRSCRRLVPRLHATNLICCRRAFVVLSTVVPPARLRVVVPSSRAVSSCRQPHLLMSCRCRAVVMCAIVPSCRRRAAIVPSCRAVLPYVCIFRCFKRFAFKITDAASIARRTFSRFQEVFIQDTCDAERSARQIFSRFQEGCIQDNRRRAHNSGQHTGCF